MRWFKNPPYLLPNWISEDFVKGIVESQLDQIMSVIRSRLPEERDLDKILPYVGHNEDMYRGWNACIDEMRDELS